MRQFFDKLIKIKRLKGSGNIRTPIATATADASIQPLSADSAQYDEGVFGKTFVAYVDADTPAQKGDIATDNDGNAYVISDVVLRDYGAFPCKELMMRRTNA